MMTMSVVCVCVCVCLSVCEHISRNTCPVFANLLHVLPMAVAQSSSCDVAIHYVLPVFHLTCA